jgi:hypothetical protein
MKAIIDRRFALTERSATVLARGAEIWTYGAQTKRLLRQAGDQELTPAAALPRIATEDGALAWDGSNLLVADRSTRRVFRVELATGRESLAMDPATLAFASYDPALKLVDAVIGDIAWHNGLLIVAVQAGYSSAIYSIDLQKKQIVSHRLAPGPKPTGVEFDPADGSLYVIDSRNRELRRFATDGKMATAELAAELVEPRGLTIDAERGFWTTDWSAGELLRFQVEG